MAGILSQHYMISMSLAYYLRKPLKIGIGEKRKIVTKDCSEIKIELENGNKKSSLKKTSLKQFSHQLSVDAKVFG